MAGLVRVARLAKVSHKVEHGLVHAHVLARVVLWEPRRALDQRQAQHVREVLAADAAQPLEDRTKLRQISDDSFQRILGDLKKTFILFNSILITKVILN